MELWIRSQNKKKLYKCDEIDLEKDAFKDWCIETKIGNDYVVKDSWCIYINNKLFGRYFNEERALEVLDEIQQILVPKFKLIKGKIEGSFDGIIFKSLDKGEIQEMSCYVYEIPEE